MSCPETTWRQALAHRFDPQVHEPEEWGSLRAHLETCDDCRREAVAVDPSLLFGLRAAAPEAGAGDEVAAMQQAVTTMRRAARVERGMEGRRSGLARLRTARWTRWAAAAILTVAALAYGGLGLDGWDPGTETQTSEPVSPREARVESLSGLQAAHVPIFEGLDRPEARVYDWTSEDSDVAVLMIVDENLDV